MVPGFETWGVITGVLAGLLLLSLVRLLSERFFEIGKRAGRRSEKRWCMPRGKHRQVEAKEVRSRSFYQYVLETVWTCGAGVMAAHWPP